MKFDRERYDSDDTYHREMDHYLATRIMKCMYCRTETMVPTVIAEYRPSYTINGKEVEVVIENFECWQCTHCGTKIVGDKGSQQSEDAFVKAGGRFAFTSLFGVSVVPPDETQPKDTILIEYEDGDPNKRIKFFHASDEVMRRLKELRIADGNYLARE